MHINHLSGDSQLAIFGYLSPITLLTSIPLVCSRWHQIQPFATKHLRSLSLTFDIEKVQDILEHSALCPESLNRPYVQTLCATFPSISHLHIFHYKYSIATIDEQLYLLQHWGPRLVSLNLCYIFEDDQEDSDQEKQQSQVLRQILEAISTLPRLKRLRLSLHNDCPQMDFPIFKQLAVLVVNSVWSCQPIIAALLKYAEENANLRQIELPIGPLYFNDYIQLLGHRALSSKILRWRIVPIMDTVRLGMVAQYCTKLQLLSLYVHLHNFQERALLLAKLPCLSELKLIFVQRERRPFTSHPLPQLDTVLALYLSFDRQSVDCHEHFTQVTQLDHLFSKLQEAYFHFIKHDGRCRSCRQKNSGVRRCTIEKFKPLGRIPSLTVVEDVTEATDWLPQLKENMD